MKEQPTEPTTSSLNPFRVLGGLVSDLAEGLQYAAKEIVEIPDALVDGWKNGAMLDTEHSEALKQAEKETQSKPKAETTPEPEVQAPTAEYIKAEIERLNIMLDNTN